MYKALIFCITIFLISPIIAFGQYTSRQRFNQQYGGSSNHHHNNVFVKTFDFNDVVIQQKIVEFDAEYFLGLDGYFSIIDEARYNQDKLKYEEVKAEQDKERAKTDALIKELLEQNKKALELLSEQIKSSGNNKPCPDPEKPEEPTPTPIPEPTPTPEPEPAPEQPEPAPEPQNNEKAINKQVYDIFTKQKGGCATCHGPEEQEGKLQLVGTNNDGENWLVDANYGLRQKIYERVADIDLKPRGLKLMPLGGPRLSDEEVKVVKAWMDLRKDEQ